MHYIKANKKMIMIILLITWQSTRYSIVFIICSSDSIARLSFSTREARNLGWKAIYIFFEKKEA